MAEPKSKFLNKILEVNPPAIEEAQKSYSSERQHTAQAFNLHVDKKDGRTSQGFAWSHYTGYQWTDELETERLFIIFGTRAIEIEGENLVELVFRIGDGQLTGIRELTSARVALLRQSNPDNEPIIITAKFYPDFENIIKEIKGEDDDENGNTRRPKR